MKKNEVSPQIERRILDKQAAASLIGCTTRTLENYMRGGLVPYLKLGRTVKFDREDILKHLLENCRILRKS